MLDNNSIYNIKDSIKLLPDLPGVYRFLNNSGAIIYIGKAKNIKKRVSQYFQSKDKLTLKTRVLVQNISKIEHTIVENEEDALLLENSLIKEHQPKYNIMLKDDKTFPSICIKNEPFSRVFSTRKIINDGSIYFGPYSSANHVNSLIETIGSIFYLRNCNLDLSKDKIDQKRYKPCLQYHIFKCKAPCTSLFSLDEYQKQIELVKLLLKGESKYIITQLKAEMIQASNDLRFEEAHIIKQKIEILQNHNKKSIIVNHTISDVDVFSISENGNLAYGNFLRVVNGAVINALNITIKNPLEENKEIVLSRFISQIHSKFGSNCREIIVRYTPLYYQNDKRITIPKIGDKLKLLQLSEKNASILKIERIKQEELLRPDDHKERVVSAIMKDLSLSKPPLHIECFDNSNIQGNNPVAACVVFKNGVPSKRDYRHFNIKTVIGPDDYSSMYEVVYRRYKRILLEEENIPDLIVIDGGKGQLNKAIEALTSLGLNDKIEIIGLAKRLEEIIIPGDPTPLFLDKNSQTLKTLMHIRDEAHRFGISHHRNKRSKEQINSILRSIPGIGPKIESKLLKHFKNISNIKRASLDQISEIAGKKVAQEIINYLYSTFSKQ